MNSVTSATTMHSVNSLTSVSSRINMGMGSMTSMAIKPQYRKVYIPIGVYRYGDRI